MVLFSLPEITLKNFKKKINFLNFFFENSSDFWKKLSHKNAIKMNGMGKFWKICSKNGRFSADFGSKLADFSDFWNVKCRFLGKKIWQHWIRHKFIFWNCIPLKHQDFASFGPSNSLKCILEGIPHVFTAFHEEKQYKSGQITSKFALETWRENKLPWAKFSSL